MIGWYTQKMAIFPALHWIMSSEESKSNHLADIITMNCQYHILLPQMEDIYSFSKHDEETKSRHMRSFLVDYISPFSKSIF